MVKGFHSGHNPSYVVGLEGNTFFEQTESQNQSPLPSDEYSIDDVSRFGSAGRSPVRGDFNHMLQSRIDHIVITAPSLSAGAELVERTLGVTPEPGGKHRWMGTHNLLLRIGEAMYLEVIALDPDAPPPKGPRWFELDGTIARTTAGLTTWVAATNDIESAVLASNLSVGAIESMDRGEFNWLITIPSGGTLPLNGIAPTLIQWLSEPHPADKLHDVGCSLIRLEGFHCDAEGIAHMLKSIGFEGEFSVSPLPAHKHPYLVAYIQTPSGVRQLGTP